MEKNNVSKIVKDKKKANKADPCDEERDKSMALTKTIEELTKTKLELEAKLTVLVGKIGNIVGDKTAPGNDEANNRVERTWGDIPELEVNGEELGHLHHHEIMACLDIVEFERGARVAGHRGYYLKGAGVLLNQALINYGLATLMQKGYTPLQPPFFLKKEIMEATCQLNDFEENLYKVVKKDDEPPLYLTATSEQPISALHMGEWIKPKDLPLKYGGISTCFRKEAGSAGQDVWGIFRVHQFEKVEQFIYCDPKKSWEGLEELISTSESFYQALKLPYRVINIVAGALNDAAAMKYDLEAWFPGFKDWRELVSCSNCTDFQSRALETRYHD
jgi:seryl-tRNA synthetase